MTVGLLVVLGVGWILGMAILALIFYAYGERL